MQSIYLLTITLLLMACNGNKPDLAQSFDAGKVSSTFIKADEDKQLDQEETVDEYSNACPSSPECVGENE